MKKKLFKGSKKKLSADMIRDWFDTVINPILDRLKDECDLINICNFTWRFRPRGFEFLREIEAYIDQSGKRNLEQIVFIFPSAKRYVQEHDTKIKLLEEKCAILHRALTQDSQDLHIIYQRAISKESLKELAVEVRELFGSYNQDDQIALIAEYIVNQKGELPYYHTISPLWNKYRNDFLAVLDKKPLLSKKKDLIIASQELLLKSQDLIQFLDEMRMDLSLEYGLSLAKSTSRTVSL